MKHYIITIRVELENDDLAEQARYELTAFAETIRPEGPGYSSYGLGIKVTDTNVEEEII